MDHSRGTADSLDSVRTERTLRDVLREVAVDALVPAGWRVGTEVVTFGDEPLADGVTLCHPDRPRDLLVTPAGADAATALAVYERDRSAGRRTAVASVPPGDDDRATLEDALSAAGRAAARIDGREASPVDVTDRDPTDSLRTRVGNALKRVHLY
ncbi:hypothetical protein [Candidatus Halobonum tyrrellensis]|nr:hypothetical protein [Candidatus Halobonum tyrrellensis]